MKRLIFSALVLSAVTANAQVKNGMVGINTDEPRATMHIEPGVSESKGLIIPRITAAQMKTMSNLAHFGADHHAIITYLKETLPAADRTGKLVDVADPGYYYYDNTTGVQKWKTFGGGAEQDFKALPTSTPGQYNYLTKGAGVLGQGTSLGTGSFNIGIGGAGTFNLPNSSAMTGDWNTGIGQGVFQFPNGGTMSASVNVGMGFAVYSLYNGGSMTGGSNVGMGMRIYTFNKSNAQFSGIGNTSIGQNIFNLQNGDLTGGNNIGMGNGLYSLNSGNMAGNNNVGIGYSSYYVDNGDITFNAQNNIALGSHIYRLTNSNTSTFSGSGNIGIGQHMYRSNGDITGNSNIGIGNNSLYAGAGGLTGSDNIAMGSNSLRGAVAVSGSNNIALGNSAMYSNGHSVTGSKNIAIGETALFANGKGIDGDNNIAIGESALYNNGSSQGNENIGIGTRGGAYHNLGNGNVFLGNGSVSTDTPRIDNVIAIGHGILLWGTPDNVILLGNNDTTNPPKIGMGTYDPQAKLDVNGGVRVGQDNSACTYSNKGTIRFENLTNKFQGCDGSNWVNLN